jgi:hypothetical protein
MEDFRNKYNNLFKIPAGKRSLGRPRWRWKNIKLYHKHIVWRGVCICVRGCMDWIHLAHDSSVAGFLSMAMDLLE